MNSLGNITPPGNSGKKNQSATNPFARALAESEKGAYAGKNSQADEKNDLFGEALARAGGKIPQENSPQELKKQEAKLKKEKKKAELRKKLTIKLIQSIKKKFLVPIKNELKKSWRKLEKN